MESKRLTATMLSEYIHYLNSQKPAFEECNNFENISNRIGEEVEELKEAVELYPDDPFKIGSELADILYLTLWLCAEGGFNIEDLILWKTKRNEEKYPASKLQGGCEGIAQLKAEWVGDEVWENNNCKP